ncbi:uncharacterized protein LACBIDRAFT_318208 [Laccaria bicolor S238N-H82]|uniref:Predicted protein n=1 Tax=Laccaria bicolor (strain S238N-H82 / ATCC MYA-4686) TaxID=486041 RepID=B0D679_LACBS|nr:uncharacterized protein LACBIDRAFT_318208 [Laccaria bicolor S238N-H82]EDR10153.1 predicted protein [Laccaria bicolor S238N-H82]|eukprot:XP_001879538.1 predicted protein [Laccaria bicolor S238N-H82]
MAKGTKPKILDIPWAENDDRLVWEFITECEKDVNYKVLFGKKEIRENTSGDSKITMFKRIAKVIMPDLFAVDGTTIDQNIPKARCSTSTGGGLEDENCENSQEEHMKYYIPGEGPNDTTPVDALNLWQQIEKDFKFFPRLHKIFATCPNVTPIVVTTVLGPQGRKTVWFQPPNDTADSTAGSAVDLAPLSTPACRPTHTFGTDVTQAIVNANGTPVPVELPQKADTRPPVSTDTQPPISTDARPPVSAGKRAPKSSAISQEAINKARLNIEKVPQKHTLLDTLLDMQEKNNKMWSDEAKEKLLIQKRAHLLDEFKLGIYDRETYLEKKAELEGGSPPAKCQNMRQFSPDWDDANFYTADQSL